MTRRAWPALVWISPDELWGTRPVRSTRFPPGQHGLHKVTRVNLPANPRRRESLSQSDIARHPKGGTHKRPQGPPGPRYAP